MHQEFNAPEELRDAIKCFWYNRKVYGPEQSSFEVVPDGYAEIIFHFGTGCSVTNNGAIQPLPSPFLTGLLNKPAVFYAQGIFQIIAIRCYPWMVFDLLGLPSAKNGVHVFEHSIALLQPSLEACINAGNVQEAVDLIKQYFVDGQSRIEGDAMLRKAGAAMREAKGTLPVHEVAVAAHATVRTLERNFKRSSGHTVKDVSALMRFEQVRNRLWTDPKVSLAGLAAELGYTDQSHLSREFKRFAGTTPAAFARKAKKGQQVLTGDFVAFVQS